MSFEAKDPAEIVTLSFAYSSELGTATIASAALSITVQSGTDPDVGSMLLGAATISGGDVLQQVRLGVAQCDYMVRCLSTLNDGRKLLRAGTLPVRVGG
jgi:hypothetical protein